jgi:hypothetical protein
MNFLTKFNLISSLKCTSVNFWWCRQYAKPAAVGGNKIKRQSFQLFEYHSISFKYFSGLGKKKVGKGKLGPVLEKKVIPVETDATKLVNYVCGSNINKTGEDIKVSIESFSN